MPEARLARARKTLPADYVYQPPTRSSYFNVLYDRIPPITIGTPVIKQLGPYDESSRGDQWTDEERRARQKG